MNLNKEKIIRILKEYNLDTNCYVVISGAAMVLYGIKEDTSDIDIAVTNEYYNYLINNYNIAFERVNEFNHNCYTIDNLINYSIDYYTNDYQVIDGIPVQSINELKKLKQYLKRLKDKKDLELINNYIKNR